MVNQTYLRCLIYIILTLGKFHVFSNHMLRFVNSVALKTQFTSKWTQSDIVKDNFPITQGQHVICDYNSPEQSI